MGKKFLNTGTSRIGFGAGYTVEPGEVIELSDELAKKKNQAIEQMLKTGQIEKGGKKKLVQEDPEDEPEDNPDEEPKVETPEDEPKEEKPKGKGRFRKR